MANSEDLSKRSETVLKQELAIIQRSREARGVLRRVSTLSEDKPPKGKVAKPLWSMIKQFFLDIKNLPRCEKRRKDDDFCEQLLEQHFVGLAISGGGIRSATLSLGILQGLAGRGLLKHVDYLSTVSGGGYIGCWLVSWILRLGKVRGCAKALEDVQSDLRSGSKNVESIHNLRRYSNYLTPNVSLLSADAWTLMVIWVRNTLLNLTMIVFGITFILLLPRYAGYGLLQLLHPSTSPAFSLDSWIVGICLLFAAYFTGKNLFRSYKGRGTGMDQARVQRYVVLPVAIASVAMAEWTLRLLKFHHTFIVDDWLLKPMIVLALLYLVAAVFGGFVECFAGQHSGTPAWLQWASGLSLVLLASVLAGLLGAVVLHGAILLLDQIPTSWRPWAAICAGPPAVLATLALGMVLQIGLMGHDLPDASREWLGRLRAWTLIYSVAWVAVTGISIFGPYLVYWADSYTTSLTLGGVWATISAIGVLGGKSDKTSGNPSSGMDWKSLVLESVTNLAPYVFALGFTVLISLGIHELLIHHLATPPRVTATGPRTTLIPGTPDSVTLTFGKKQEPESLFEAHRNNYAHDLNVVQIGQLTFHGPKDLEHLQDLDFYNLGSLCILVVVGGMLLSLRVNINDFSMQHFYKNRLVRCYLGASRPADGECKRTPDPFTGFDPKDDIPLRYFADRHEATEEDKECIDPKTYCGPYPIINGALNLAGGTPLAWQERKAASFVFTPLYCGYDREQLDEELKGSEAENAGLADRAYFPTAQFAYPGGPEIGTAMGISGAAASPNEGYHTSPAVAFLMTIFNVRLGWWLGNPARRSKGSRPGPSFGLTYLITELFGLANASKAFVNVSDGGHFENLGIYELVRRRCRYIIVCDGEQDGELKFEGLANAIRKCCADFDVKIDIDVEQIRLKDGFSRAHCVVGKIIYPEAPRQKQNANYCSYLLYLKSSLTGNEDTDVLQYHSTHLEFPHQSTADQWFDESQFESYRKLGLHIVNSAFPVADEVFLNTPYADLKLYNDAKAKLFSELQDLLYPPSDAIQKSFTKNAGDYSKLVDEIAKDKSISYLDSTIFNMWKQTPVPPNTREGRYLCISFLQLMENVFLDLQLDDLKQQAHPHNSGWMALFREWAKSNAFQDAWKVAGGTYGKRFQAFYKSLANKQR